ncbi:hypothetical protein AVEN_128780-1 [Araneus ventricosus]|uniref:Uncharacterized protein n=1 Tax=Araneus ventricosus TaxID=182803 RepID=A0A4Y2RN96_ARAVE|nr:hypothetical protein AVEN_128780-1 [Araneus ventricosus]
MRLNWTLPTSMVIYPTPTPCYNLPLNPTEMGSDGQGELNLLPRLSTKKYPHLPLKGAKILIPGFVAVKGKFVDRSGPPRLV